VCDIKSWKLPFSTLGIARDLECKSHSETHDSKKTRLLAWFVAWDADLALTWHFVQLDFVDLIWVSLALCLRHKMNAVKERASLSLFLCV